MIAIIRATSLPNLQTRCIGFNHDHSRALYFGKTICIPDKYKKYANESDYVGIFEIDDPMNMSKPQKLIY